MMQTVSLPMSDGDCDALVCLPPNPRHAVLWCPDALGIRPANAEQAARLAEWGVAVLMPNVFYRSYRPPLIADGSEVGGEDPDFAASGVQNFKAFDFTTVDTDAPRWAEYLLEESGLDSFSFVGFCMGGRVGIRVARSTGEDCTYLTAFHPGSVIRPDDPDSEHLLLVEVDCPIYFGYADDDPSMTAEDREGLQRAADEVGADLTGELYPGARHGFMMPDRPVFDPEAADRGWRHLANLYRS